MNKNVVTCSTDEVKNCKNAGDSGATCTKGSYDAVATCECSSAAYTGATCIPGNISI